MRLDVHRDAQGNPTHITPMWSLTCADVRDRQMVMGLQVLWLAAARGMGGRWVFCVPRFESFFALKNTSKQL